MLDNNALIDLHGGPAMVANIYLEGSYSELYPSVAQDVDGMRHLFKQFSFPGGIPSHAAAETPGSINEGGELGSATRSPTRAPRVTIPA
jgi:xylulose-5-phosphate/fructose-6-phosphate phosphoketolase